MTGLPNTTDFPSDRASGLARLDAFAPKAGRAYRELRNYDYGPGRHDAVSRLSPYLRRRLVTEQEVLFATLGRHSLSASEKFVQEVFWRGYFKGWLEHRPSIWADYAGGLLDDLDQLGADAELESRWRAAIAGRTGLDAFDAWAQELVETGYLHNHARMWFASIWIFTLALPWRLGADFFLRHLVDGDPASNTLSWRWVGGLHTRGKTYLARADNIAKYTEGRFAGSGERARHLAEELATELATSAPPLDEPENPRPTPPRAGDPIDKARPDPAGPDAVHHDQPRRFALILTEEDASPETLFSARHVATIGAVTNLRALSPLPLGDAAQRFADGAMADALHRAGGAFDAPTQKFGEAPDVEAVLDWAHAAEVDAIATAYAPIGPVADWLDRLERAAQGAGMRVLRVKRDYDAAVWPHASKGFFALKEKIPRILREIGLTGAER